MTSLFLWASFGQGVCGVLLYNKVFTPIINLKTPPPKTAKIIPTAGVADFHLIRNATVEHVRINDAQVSKGNIETFESLSTEALAVLQGLAKG